MSHRWVPSTFKGDEPPVRIPHVAWQHGHELLHGKASTIALVRIPPFWQFEIPVHDACRANGVAPYYVHPHNMALGIASVVSLEPESVITTSENLATFVHEVRQKSSHMPSLWIVIHDAATPWHEPPGLPHVEVEYHRFPGMPENI